jgi:hypothetical protein
MVSPTVKTIRIAQMTPVHVAAVNAVAVSPQTLGAIATSLGVSADEAEKRMGIAVDQALVTRSMGSRTTATYSAA